MNVDEIKALMEAMGAHDISEVVIRDGESRIVLRRGAEVTYAPAPQMYAMPSVGHAAPAAPSLPAPAQPAAGSAPAAPAPSADAGLIPIKAPMVGTFYTTPDPDSPAFVKPGSSVTSDSVVCIIEAMKVFNEIKAEVSGTIERVMVEKGAAVEFGQVLFLVKPN